METLGRRLATALESWGGSKSQFVEEMRSRGIRGSSLPSLASYLNDEVIPRLEWQIAAAEILGIRLQWLSQGGGEARPAEQALSEQVATEASDLEQYMIGILEAAPWLYDRADTVTKLLLYHAAMTGAGAANPVDVGRVTMEAVLEPLHALGIRFDQLPDRTLARYLGSIAQALAGINADMNEQGAEDRTLSTCEGARSFISFGLVHIPVELFIDCPVGKTRITTADPLRSTAAGTEQSEYPIKIELFGFVPLEEVDTSYLAQAYYVGPTTKSLKGYALLREAIRNTRKVAVGVLSLDSRDHLCLLLTRGNVFHLHLIRSPDDVRSFPGKEFPDLSLEELGLTQHELGMATALVMGMPAPWEPDSWASLLQHDRPDHASALVETPNVTQMTERLAESLEAMKSGALPLRRAG